LLAEVEEAKSLSVDETARRVCALLGDAGCL
jgi:hypothetical protein